MGFWKRFGTVVQKGAATAAAIAPVLPIPDKYKKAVVDAQRVEQDVEAVIEDVKPTKPAA